eukprot:Clim_evm5s185 gene=Clim_evmTU5s185
MKLSIATIATVGLLGTSVFAAPVGPEAPPALDTGLGVKDDGVGVRGGVGGGYGAPVAPGPSVDQPVGAEGGAGVPGVTDGGAGVLAPGGRLRRTVSQASVKDDGVGVRGGVGGGLGAPVAPGPDGVGGRGGVGAGVAGPAGPDVAIVQ